jgi:hypothetical protein
MVKKNRGHFPIAVPLTTLICSHQTTANLFFWFYDCNAEILGACNTPLERYFQDLSSSISKAPILKISVQTRAQNLSLNLWSKT